MNPNRNAPQQSLGNIRFNPWTGEPLGNTQPNTGNGFVRPNPPPKVNGGGRTEDWNGQPIRPGVDYIGWLSSKDGRITKFNSREEAETAGGDYIEPNFLRQTQEQPIGGWDNPGGMGFWTQLPDGSWIGGDSFTGRRQPIGWQPGQPDMKTLQPLPRQRPTTQPITKLVAQPVTQSLPQQAPQVSARPVASGGVNPWNGIAAQQTLSPWTGAVKGNSNNQSEIEDLLNFLQ